MTSEQAVPMMRYPSSQSPGPTLLDPLTQAALPEKGQHWNQFSATVRRTRSLKRARKICSGSGLSQSQRHIPHRKRLLIRIQPRMCWSIRLSPRTQERLLICICRTLRAREVYCRLCGILQVGTGTWERGKKKSRNVSWFLLICFARISLSASLNLFEI